MERAELDAQFASEVVKDSKFRSVVENMLQQHEWFRRRHPGLVRFLGNSSGTSPK